MILGVDEIGPRPAAVGEAEFAGICDACGRWHAGLSWRWLGVVARKVCRQCRHWADAARSARRAA